MARLAISVFCLKVILGGRSIARMAKRGFPKSTASESRSSRFAPQHGTPYSFSNTRRNTSWASERGFTVTLCAELSRKSIQYGSCPNVFPFEGVIEFMNEGVNGAGNAGSQ